MPNETTTTSSRPCVLVTGGAGYIGSHTLTVLLEADYDVVVVDNLDNSTSISLDRVAQIVGLSKAEQEERIVFHKVDCCDKAAFRAVFEQSPRFESCIHFAALKAVGESTQIPLRYYENNLQSLLNLLQLLDEFDCHSVVFSSSCTVYGQAKSMPISEASPVGQSITNAYGRSKYVAEQILGDYFQSKVLQATKDAQAVNDWSICILRYFNPVGSHPTGLIGEDPNGIPNCLSPYIAQVAVGRRPYLTVFGDDYPTADGTAVRDYLHVMDCADGHLKAMEYMQRNRKGLFHFNLGTGIGYSVLDMVNAMSKACGKEIPYRMGPRRDGDVAICYADPALAAEELGWKAFRTLDDMCRDVWSWQSQNPNGYVSKEE